jgi:hypothetical protein
MFKSIGNLFGGNKEEEKQIDKSYEYQFNDKMETLVIEDPNMLKNAIKLKELFYENKLNNWSYSKLNDEYRPGYASPTGGVGK